MLDKEHQTLEWILGEPDLIEATFQTVHRGVPNPLFCCIITSVKQNDLTTLCLANPL
jgi:hypothetical protein